MVLAEIFSLLRLIGRPAIWGWRKVADRISRYKAHKAASRGQNLAASNSLRQVIALELGNLAARDDAPSGVQLAAYRNWLKDDRNLENFAAVLIAGGEPSIAKRARGELVVSYELLTRDTRAAPVNLVDYVTSYVVGQLQATDSGRQQLGHALTRWSATQIYAARSAPQDFPTEDDLRRVREAAAAIVEAGKRSWKMPRFVAPLRLETFETEEGRDPRGATPSDILEVSERGQHVLLFGSGGIGKTTLLLELATSWLERQHRIPIFVDAAAWGEAHVGLFEHVAGLPECQANGVSAADLTKMAISGDLAVLLNGWNEVPPASKLACRESLVHITTTAELLPIVVVSRSHNDSTILPGTRLFEVRGLSWDGQTAIVRAELGNELATTVLDVLAKDTRLRHACRSPLILRGVVSSARHGIVGNSSVFDLLGASVQAFEEGDQRHLTLSSAPVDGHQRAYLEEIACTLTSQRTTTCSRDAALGAINSAARKLIERHLIGGAPNTNAVFEILVTHHLLHFQGDAVRFSHQRFQEYFAAKRLLQLCLERADPTALLPDAVNEPAWEDALLLLAGKLKGAADHAPTRLYLLKAAVALDIGFACDLAGACGFGEADDADLHRAIVERVDMVVASPMQDVRELGTAYQIASRLPAFADRLWPLLEHEDQQVRLTTHRLNGTPLALKQLGPAAQQRVAAWSPERRAEFLHEIAENPDNYDFIAGLAQNDPEPTVQAAAISALFWNFPASDVPIRSWLSAPEAVQTDHQVLSMVHDALGDGQAEPAVRARLKSIANGKPANAQIHLAIAFPNDIGPLALDAIFASLGEGNRQTNYEPLVGIAKKNSPERLLDVACELVTSKQFLPDWVVGYLRDGPPDVRTAAVEKAWNSIIAQGRCDIDLDGLGSLANVDQVQRSVEFLLQHVERERAFSIVENDRHRAIEQMVSHAQGPHLLGAVVRLCHTVTYAQSAYLLELLLRRINREVGLDESKVRDRWNPSAEEVQRLVTLFGPKEAPADDVNCAVQIYLCGIASHVASGEFTGLILQTCKLHLDAWNSFQTKIIQWSHAPRTPRPMNPYLGNYLLAALANCGPDVLPELLNLLTHPSAMKLVPEAIVRVVSLPWAASGQERPFSSIATDMQEGARRLQLGRVALQPDDKYQVWTDAAAKALGARLSERIVEVEKNVVVDARKDARSGAIGDLAKIVSRIPSSIGQEAVRRALASGLMDAFSAVAAVRSLLRQGTQIHDASIARGLEAIYKREAAIGRFEEATRYAMASLCELLVTVVPPALLASPVNHYLEEWRRYENHTFILRRLGATRSEAAWRAIVTTASEIRAKERLPEEVMQALSDTLASSHLDEFFALVADGTLAAWSNDGAWTIKRLAPNIAKVIEGAGAAQSLANACSNAKSSFADLLAGEVLSHVSGAAGIRETYLLEAAHAGRAVDSHHPAYGLLEASFKLETPLGGSRYRVEPAASNTLRAELYASARSTGAIANGCKCLLASVELSRREMGRPADEPRHPAFMRDHPWTDALLLGAVN